MKATKFGTTFLLIGLFLFSNPVFSQWEEAQISANFSIPPIALVDIEPSINNSISFTILPSSESGAAPQIQESSNEALWINYSSALPASLNSRSIVAQISEGILPTAISLYLDISMYQGMGEGQHGQPMREILLTNQPKEIITNIGNCYTGDGSNNGHSLSFSIDISDYSTIPSTKEYAFTITYTIIDN